jgi:hypothetical protein
MEPMIDPLLDEEVLRLVGNVDASHRGNAIVRRKPSRKGSRYSSEWIHSDVWSGNPAGFIVMFPISGDFENTGVEFFKPTKNLDLLNLKYNRYENVPDFGPEYIGKMEEGYMHVVDAFCLHRTMPGENTRVSVDMRFGYEGTMDVRRAKNFVPIWHDLEGRN